MFTEVSMVEICLIHLFLYIDLFWWHNRNIIKYCQYRCTYIHKYIQRSVKKHLLSHNTRSKCWWYGSRGWTLLSINLCFFAFAVWHQSGQIAWMIWKCIWSSNVSMNSFIWHSLMFVECLWRWNNGCKHG